MSDAPDKPDAAHVLFPNDAPASSKPPEWFKNERTQAAARLSGMGNLSKPADTPKPDNQAAAMFPSEGKPAQGETPAAGAKAASEPPAGSDKPDVAATLFKGDAEQAADKQFDGAREFFTGFAGSAAADGDSDRAAELQAAGAAIIENAKASGMPEDELAAALDIVKERQGDTIAEITDEKLQQEFSSSMATLKDELGETYLADIGLAQRMIADVERVAPGTMDSLIATGAGNDVRLIRSVIREAKRRGYR